jgi:predicted nucleotidyltransferase
MNTDPIVQTLKNAIPDLRTVYLFGSRAHGAAGVESDWDIAFLASRPLPDIERYDLAQTLAAQINRDVDLLDLATANAVMRMQAIGRGRCLYRLDDPEIDAFEDFVFADYARLNEERAGILADIRKRGSVYGR